MLQSRVARGNSDTDRKFDTVWVNVAELKNHCVQIHNVRKIVTYRE